MDLNWLSMTDFMYLSLFLGIAAILKEKFKFFSKLLIPTSILAGFVGMLLGPEILNIVPFNAKNLENLVYHLMALGFIALTLKERENKKTADSYKTGVFIVSTYLIQGIVGFIISLGLLYTIYPDIFPTFGLLLPLGYGQGPGQAYSIGSQWEKMGFENGGQIGLTIATFGFLWACFGGVPVLNYLVRKKKLKHVSTAGDIIQRPLVEKSEPGEIPLSSGLDKITLQFFLIGIVYLVTYLILKGLSNILTPLGLFGETMSNLLWGFHFLIATVLAMAFRMLYDFLKKKNYIKEEYTNNYLLQRISGSAFDYMIAASISVLSLYAIKSALIPILILSTAGGIVSIVYIIWLGKKVYKTHVLENTVALYGMLTGTISTGLALLKEVDPEFKTQAAENLVLGSASGLLFGLPLLAILNIPVMGYVNKQPLMYLYTLLALILYFIIILTLLLAKRNRKSLSMKEAASDFDD
ncbi:sodium/glutamate symporter [Clostridium thermarum]|uniref:sodium/glutamate symporter n=1 Tax=Clostridium thermarum TaxID=1716543 RepID=UPI001123B598|nr:sodium/glutamate symporter [Clostridium thermarum]